MLFLKAKKGLRNAARAINGLMANIRLALLRRRMVSLDPNAPGTENVLNYTVRINDGPNFYILYKDIFIKHIYHFEPERTAEPFILDCGSNIGMSILYFKSIYPGARIIGFEPDPVVFPYLKNNVERNLLKDVSLLQAAVSGHEGTMAFYSDGKFGSCLAEHSPSGIPGGWFECKVPCVRLRDYLTEPVDFLKMNIEGAEWEVLADSEDYLRQVREMVIEYHHSPGLPPTLHKILELLHNQGFDYLINDFDSETNMGVQPPFSLTPDSRYYLLVYARRQER